LGFTGGLKHGIEDGSTPGARARLQAPLRSVAGGEDEAGDGDDGSQFPWQHRAEHDATQNKAAASTHRASWNQNNTLAWRPRHRSAWFRLTGG
jgi:hypothetical protein